MKLSYNKKHNVLLKFLTVIFIIIFCISSYLLICDFLEYKKNDKDNKELIEDVVQNSAKEELNINWNYLKSVNNDIIGWININDTNINYPILKDNNNLFYLKHSYNKKYNKNGSIFTINTNLFEDDETIIFGHNMRNGTMFSTLSKYLDDDFLKSHPSFKIYTPTVNYNCTIFSVYSIGVETESNNIKQLDFTERIRYYKKISKYSLEIVNSVNKIVKLSTCSYINAKTIPTDQRYYIIANVIPIE